MRKGYINARIYKSDASAFMVEDERIGRLGSNEEILALLDEQDEVIDLNHMFVLPGFIDSHMHLLEFGYYLDHVILDQCHSIADVQTKLKSALKTLRQGQWLIGRGYNEDNFDIVQKPTRQHLDEVSTEVPIVITRACGHVMCANTKALEEAGITEETAVEGGSVDYESGLLEENALHLMHEAQPKPGNMDMQDYILKGAKYMNQVGVTTVGSDDFMSLGKDYVPVLDTFEKMAFQERLNVRVNQQCEFPDPKTFAKFLDDGYTMDVGNDFFRIGPLKLITDGSLGARTAALSQPYADDDSTSGYLSMEPDEIRTYVQLANHFNMPVIAHCIGDQAVEAMLEVFKDELYEGNPLHSGLVHCQIMRKDQIEDVIKLGLSCYIQSQFIDYDASIVNERVGNHLAMTSYPYKTLFEHTITSNGSDAPVEMPNPLLGIQLAATRQSVRYAGSEMYINECLSVEQAIDSYTEAAAKQLFMNDCIGKIAEGYYADIVVLNQDITTIPVDTIANTKVMMTLMNGKLVYER